MAKLNLKTVNKKTKDQLITFVLVIAVYIVVQIMVAAGAISSLMQGLLVPMCTYSIVAIGLNLCVGYLGELSIGHAGFMCVGAFSSAFCTKLLEGVIGSSFYWKGLSASINFRYRVGGQIFLSALYNKVENISDQDVYYNQDKRALYDRWQKPGDVAKFKAISLNETTPMSSRFVADENTLSCESVSIGYETQARWLRHFGASSMTIRGYMNDIFRISTVKNERGLDYPFARSVAFSLGIRF